MSQESQDVDYNPLDRMRRITFKELDAFYEEMGTEHACERCQSVAWNHICDPDGPVALKIPAFDREESFAVAFVIACKRCGNLRYTNGGAIVSWLNEREKQ